jgi:hypothetical protein
VTTRCGARKVTDGGRCRNARPCRWHANPAAAQERELRRAWLRSDYRYMSARLAHLNPPERVTQRWDGGGPDGDGGEPLPYSA